MIIEQGGTLLLSDHNGSDTAYVVRAIRHFPIDFVELQPCDGGPTQTMSMSAIERVARPS